MSNYTELNTETVWYQEQAEYLEERAYESKLAQFKLDAVEAAIKDFLNKSNIEVQLLKDCYVDEEDISAIEKISAATTSLLDKLTEKQREILYFTVVERLNGAETAERLEIKKQTVHKQLKAIQKKGLKIEVEL
jgi:DNA-directed RNA polymerase specialized sigma24 family protein